MSAIEWTEATWNPLAGCTPVSPGCANCYAAVMARRLQAMGVGKYAGTVDAHGRWTGRISFDSDALDLPLRWRKPRMIFVNSMSDLFHDAVSDEQIDRVFDAMRAAAHHTFQVLTKRAARMADYCAKRKTLPNVWLGVSVENQHCAEERIPHLLRCPAALRFLSCEPLLGPINLFAVFSRVYTGGGDADAIMRGYARLPRVDWVIVGGESGPRARACDAAWIRGLVSECRTAGVAVFVKQLGAAAGLRDRKGGDPAEWPHDLRVREMHGYSWSKPSRENRIMKHLGASVSSIDSIEKWERFKGAFNAGVQMTFWRSLVAGGGPGQYDSTVVSSRRYMIERMANELLFVGGHPVLYELTEAMPNGTVTERHRAEHLRWWIETFGRFVHVVDVVNEPFHCPMDNWRTHYDRMRLAAPHIRTRFNEYDILNGAGTRAIRDFVRPHLDVIDVIGIQAHYLQPLRNGRLPSIDTVRRNLDAVAELGRPIHITEISIPSARGGWTEKLQAQWLDQLLGVFNVHPAVEAAFYWDLSDANAWNPTSGLWRADGTAKPAWGTVLKYVRKRTNGGFGDANH